MSAPKLSAADHAAFTERILRERPELPREQAEYFAREYAGLFDTPAHKRLFAVWDEASGRFK